MNKLAEILKPLRHLLNSLFGQIQWTSPSWLSRLGDKARTSPRAFWGSSLAILVILVGSAWIYHWYRHLPKPVLVTAQITAPEVTPLAETLEPKPLMIDFIRNQGDFGQQSVAPLTDIGKTISSGLSLSPAMPGHWLWESDSRLVFYPDKDWPAGQVYELAFTQKLFAKGTQMESLNYRFSTQSFQAKIESFEFYQDPVHPQTRQAVATLSFNFPVDPQSLQEHLHLYMEGLSGGEGKMIPYSLHYDEHKRQAYLRSDSLQLPEVSRYLVLTLDPGVEAASGPGKTAAKLVKNMVLPDLGSFFKVLKAQASIFRNPQDKPEQILTLETTVGVTEEALNQGLHLYLLPKDYPATSTEGEKKDYQWQNPGEVTPAILAKARPLPSRALPQARHFSTLHSYQFEAKTPAYLYLKLDKGTKAFAGYILSQNYEAIIPVPQFPQEISFLHPGALLALDSDKKLSVTVRGLPAVKFEVARVLPDNLNQLVTQTQGDFSNPYFINQSFDQQNIAVINSEVQSFNVTDPGQQQYTALDFGKYLAQVPSTEGPNGLFLVRAIGWDPVNNQALSTEARRLILITDLGLLVKDNNDGSHQIYAQSITKGTPAAGARVEVLGKNGLAIMTQTTDAQGMASFPNLSDFTADKEPVAYLVSQGTDQSFIPFNNGNRQLNYSRFDVGGVYVSPQQGNNLTAFLFSDRGLYRPGDEAHIGMIVKQRFAEHQPGGLPLQASVIDPRGNTLLEKQFVLDDLGYLSLNVPTTVVSPTGQYQVNLYLMKDDRPESLLGSTSFKVNEFLPDTLRIKAEFSPESQAAWLSPADLKVKVSLSNLYGTAASNRVIQSRIVLSPLDIRFSAYPDYIFSDPLRNPKKQSRVFTDTLPETHTDDQGEARLDLNLNRFEQATYQLNFFAEGFAAEGGRSVSTQLSAIVSPLPYFVGYKSEGDLGFIKQNSQQGLHFIAINPELKGMALPELRLEILQIQPVSTLVKKPDGSYQYQSVLQKKVVSTAPFSIAEAGSDFSLPTTVIGDFELRLLNPQKQVVSQARFSVVGASQQPLPKNAELRVKLDKEEYNPGDTIQLQITAPYTGAGLITIERDKVFAAQWFKADSTSSVQSIQIPKDLQGNAYVNVVFVRNWDSPEIFISPLSYDVEPFSINPQAHEVAIDLTAPDLVKPGDILTMTYHTDKPAKIIVYAVDEGILQVAGYETPDPLSFFFDKQALQVTTQQTVDQILPKFIAARELSAVGGDGEENMLLAAHLNPFKRKTDLPVVYWSGIVDADSTPRELTYQVPDYFNGSLRIMAVAVATDAVGAVEMDTQVRGPFVITPNVPTFVAPGDEMEVTATVANNIKGSGEKAEVYLSLEVSPELVLAGAAEQRLIIGEGKETVVSFRIKAGDRPGAASLHFKAALGDEQSTMHASLSVRPASPFVTAIQSGSSQKTKLQLPLTRNLYPAYRQVEAVMSTSPLILVAGLERYLDNYPYGCTEQLTSKAMPLLAMAKQPWFNQDKTAIADKINATLQMLNARQKSDGSFAYWPNVDANETDSFISVYAMQFLTEAKASGYSVSPGVFSGGIGFLKELAGLNPANLEAARTQAYAIYLLTRNEMLTTNYLANLQFNLDQHQDWSWQEDILSAYMASSYQIMQNQAEALKLIKGYQPQAPGAESDFYSPDLANAQYLYLLARHFPDQLPTKGLALVKPLVDGLNSSDINTLFAGFGSLALAAYDEQSPKASEEGLALIGLLKDKQQKTLASGLPYLKADLDEAVSAILFSNPDGMTYFYQLIQSGFDKQLPTQVTSEGMEVYREYRNLKGEVVSQAALGEELEVHIQARSLSDNYLSNVALVDLLPGGFEVVTSSVKIDTVDYADVREDRVIFFLTLNSQAQELVYRIKAVNTGEFMVPPIEAQAMYNPGLRALGLGSRIKIGG